MTIDKVVSDYRCHQEEVLQEAIDWLEEQKTEEYINKPVSVIIRIVNENERKE